MTRYIALLRGINISGKNKIAMAELKKEFSALGFADVSTYLNSGNVAFSSDISDNSAVSDMIMQMIKERFSLDIPVFTITQDELADVLENAPEWWGNDDKSVYDNIIFMLSPLTYDELLRSLGEPNHEFEKVQNYKNAVFWSYDLKNYRRTNWWQKTANADVSQMITVRTAGTVRKIAK